MVRYLTEMAVPRKKAVEIITGIADEVGEHLIKCVVYEHSLDLIEKEDNFGRWQEEIAFWLWDSGDTEVKGQYRLKKQDYENYLFGSFAEDAHDCKTQLLAFLLTNRRKKKYPEFKVTPEMCLKLFSAWTKLKERTCVLMADKTNEHNEDEYLKIVKDVCMEEHIG